jgi:hypothetical protein
LCRKKAQSSINISGHKIREAAKALAEECLKLKENDKEEYKIKSKILENERKHYQQHHYHQQMIYQQENVCTVQFWNPFNVPVADSYI